MSFRDVAITLVVAALIALLLLRPLYRHWLRLRRAEFIRTYAWPRGLLERLEKHHSGMERKDSALVSRGLRQFFVAYLMSGKRFVSMPSQVADDLWHEFILYTREYEFSVVARSAHFCITRRRPCSARSAGTMRVCGACGGTAANMKISARFDRRGCRCCSLSTPS